jgi:hypothetical protein
MGPAANTIAMLLSEAEYRWSAEPDGRQIPLSIWRQRMSHITRVRLVVRRPNPHYQDTPDLEALINQSDAEVARLELQSEHGVDLNSPFLQQTIRHIEAGYGEGYLSGITSDGTESTYSTLLHSVEQTTEAPANDDGEVDLMSVLQNVAGQSDQGDTY